MDVEPTDVGTVDELRRLAEEWDRATPTITLHEVRARAIESSPMPRGPEVIVLPARPQRHTGWIFGVAAAAIVLVVVAVAVIGGGDPAPTVVPPVESDISVSSTDPTTAASVAATTPTLTPQEQLAMVRDEVTAALSTLRSFTATATVTQANPVTGPTGTDATIDETTAVNRVTLMADGSLWSEGDAFPWSSYDAGTGTARNATVADDGTVHYQEVDGWADNSVPVNILLGHDPALNFANFDPSLGAEVTVTEVESRLGRPGWQIVAVMHFGQNDDQTDTWVIDRTTGLIIEQHTRQVTGTTVYTKDATLDDLVIDVDLPPEFPGQFPDGVTVDRSGDPNAFSTVSVVDAVQAFGGPVVVPAGLPDDAVIRVVTQRQAYDTPEPNATYFEFSTRIQTGFVSSTVTMRKTVLDPGQPVPNGTLVVDGLLCASNFGPGCLGSDGPSVVSEGALRGMPSTLFGSTVEIVDGAITVQVSAPTPDAALALANSLDRRT